MSAKGTDSRTTLSAGLEVGGGDYKLLKELGTGGSGAVWLAQNVKLHRDVALKFFSRSGQSRELDALVTEEGPKLAALSRRQGDGGEHILIVHRSIISDADVPAFLELEFMEGGSLRKKLKARSTLREEEIVSLGIQICRALICAHGHQLVHRDLKPDNILMDQDEKYFKLADFGLASRLQELTNTVAGTPAYMSPEQFTDAKRVGPPADIYALGIVLYECIEGHTPFVEEERNPVRKWEHYQRKHCTEEPVRPHNTQISEELKDIALQCLLKDPQARPLALDLLNSLRALGRTGSQGPTRPQFDALKLEETVYPDGTVHLIARHTETGLEFEEPYEHAEFYIPVRPVTNRDFLHFVHDPRHSRWSPQQIPLREHDGGYLKTWFHGTPLNGQEDEMLTAVPYQAAEEFCRWIGGELPDFQTLDRLLNLPEPPSIARAMRAVTRVNRLPFLQLWFRDEQWASKWERSLYRFGLQVQSPAEADLVRFLRRVRRPRHYCFPTYAFIPVVPAEIVHNLRKSRRAEQRRVASVGGPAPDSPFNVNDLTGSESGNTGVQTKFIPSDPPAARPPDDGDETQVLR